MASRTANAGVNYVNSQPKYLVNSTVTRVFDFVDTATLSQGDVVLMPWARIPHGAVITDVKIGGQLINGTAILLPQIEVGSTTVNLGGSLTLSQGGGLPRNPGQPTSFGESTNIPYVVSVSDDAVIRYATLKMTVQTVTSATTSASIVYMVTYTMDK